MTDTGETVPSDILEDDGAPPPQIQEDEPEQFTDCDFVELPPDDEPIIVTARDTWGKLVKLHGEDIASRNGLKFSTPLKTGQKLH